MAGSIREKVSRYEVRFERLPDTARESHWVRMQEPGVLVLRRSQERFHAPGDRRKSWSTFDPHDSADAAARSMAGLERFEEGRVAPNESIRKPLLDAEIITYVRAGALAYEDSAGRLGVIGAGEFQRMTAGGGVRYSEMNASPTDWAHVFQIVLGPAAARLPPGHEQKLFSVSERRGRLRAVVSPDARSGSLRGHQDALIYSAVLRRGQHVAHALPGGRRAWLHVVDGEGRVGDLVLGAGDGVGVMDERAVSFTAGADAELLMVELAVLPGGPEQGNGFGYTESRASPEAK